MEKDLVPLVGQSDRLEVYIPREMNRPTDKVVPVTPPKEKNDLPEDRDRVPLPYSTYCHEQ